MEMLPSDGESDEGQEVASGHTSDLESHLSRETSDESTSPDYSDTAYKRSRSQSSASEDTDYSIQSYHSECALNYMKVSDKPGERKRSRVGPEYQADIPAFIPPSERLPAPRQDAESDIFWLPAEDIPEELLQHYLNYAKENHDYSEEHALVMLHHHKNDLKRACQDMTNFVLIPDEWTDEERTLFMKAYYLYGTDFHYYKWLLPWIPVRRLVKYYYMSFKFNDHAEIVSLAQAINHARSVNNQAQRYNNQAAASNNQAREGDNGSGRIATINQGLELSDRPSTSRAEMNGGGMAPGVTIDYSAYHHEDSDSD
ncbi:REST corepressor-like [Anopheles arabiensis]|uniref:REST corepressor-like n=1 Tax=Anopheles arabiensis TaxID=7173 RepID=UPI001AAD8227|nr:REST corepressor-like [Anopheles arabiensis]